MHQGHFPPRSATSTGDSSLFVETSPELQPALRDGRRQPALQRHRPKDIAQCCSDTVQRDIVHSAVLPCRRRPGKATADDGLLLRLNNRRWLGAQTSLSIECIPNYADYSALPDGVVFDVCATSDRSGICAAEGLGCWLIISDFKTGIPNCEEDE